MPALCAAIGSFHVNSPSTYFVMVLKTVRVLPFFLTVTLIRSDTFMVSTFGVRWYSDQRYSSIQISGTMHSSKVAKELAAALVSFCTGSAVLTDASSTGGVAAGSIGRGSGKAAPPLSVSAT